LPCNRRRHHHTLALGPVGCNYASINVRVTTGLASRRCVEDGMVGACIRHNFTQRQALSMRNPAHSMERIHATCMQRRASSHVCRQYKWQLTVEERAASERREASAGAWRSPITTAIGTRDMLAFFSSVQPHTTIHKPPAGIPPPPSLESWVRRPPLRSKVRAVF